MTKQGTGTNTHNDLDAYLRDRWNHLSSQSKRLLDLRPGNYGAWTFTMSLWTRQYYKQKCIQDVAGEDTEAEG